jgi:type IV pilus assembly protein PilE
MATHSALPHLGRGFTLIELCVATTIVGILTALSVTSWRTTVLRAHRAEARVALLRIQAAQERQYPDSLRYTADLELPPSAAGLGIPRLTDGGRYALTLAASQDGQHYLARAQPAAGSTQAMDRACTEFTLDETGRTRGSSPECWP